LYHIQGLVESLDVLRPIALELGWETTLLVLLVCWYLFRLEKPVYLVDFTVFEAPKNWKVTHDQLLEIMRRQNCFTDDSVQFMARILERSGTGNATAWPPGIVKCLDGEPADRSVEAAREESSIVLFDVVRQVLENTNTNPKDIDILIVNCSLFSPTPSLCTLIINEFDMKPDILSYNLSGMGCRYPAFAEPSVSGFTCV
jgi:3-ketoacyl-CoA synthase